jgi:hypothetical protein
MRLNFKDLAAQTVQKNNHCLLEEAWEICKNICGQDVDSYDVKVGRK